MIRPRKPARPNRRSQAQPRVERLERRALMTSTGNFDRTFGVGGFYSNPITPSVGSGLVTVASVAVEADGSILEAGLVGSSEFDQPIGLVRLTASGTLDTSFGRGGEVDAINDLTILATGPASGGEPGGVSSDPPIALLVQPDGKIILVGGFHSFIYHANGSIVARFNADGTPDLGFGVDGQVDFDLTRNSLPGLNSPFDEPSSGVAFQYAALQPNGQIVLAGVIPNIQAADGNTAIGVLRLDADGGIDSSFGTNGLTTLFDSTPEELEGPISSTEVPTGVTIAPDGRIVVVGSLSRPGMGYGGIFTPPVQSPEIFRLDADGMQDPSFSQAGLQSSGLNSPTGDGVAMLPDGEILVIGADEDDSQGLESPVVVRLSGDGSTHQLATLPTSILSDNELILDAVGIAPDGDVVVSLSTELADLGVRAPTLLGLIRLKPDLTPDDTFGTDGVVSFVPQADAPSGQFYAGIFTAANTLSVSPSGQIVVGGLLLNSGYLPVPGLLNVVVRLNPTGPTSHLDDFDGDGIADPAVYLPALGAFAISDSSRADVQLTPFGGPGVGTTIPASGDYTGSGTEEIGAYLPGLGIYAYRPPTGPDVYVTIGSPGPGLTLPAPGDYYGTGQDDVAVYLADLGAFAVVDPSGKTPSEVVSFGMAGVGNAIPAPGDYFGSGKTDFAVYLPTLGEFEIQQPDGTNDYIPFGNPGSLGAGLPMPGDYDGSGVTEMALYLPALGEIAYRPALGGPDVYIPFGGPGVGTVLPMAGDYTGSGKTEPGIYIPALGELAYRPPTGPDVFIKLGIPGAGETVPVTPVVLFASEVIAGSGSGGTVSALSVPNVVVGLDTPGSPGSKKAKLGDVVSWETAALV